MNYSTKSLLRIFSRRTVSVKKAKEIGKKPKKIANWVYGFRLGNRGRNTDDGWDYRGSGYLQVTGRYNFRQTARLTGVDLENSPQLLRDPVIGFQVALAFWKAQKANAAADTDSVESCSQKSIRRLPWSVASKKLEQKNRNGALLWHGRVSNSDNGAKSFHFLISLIYDRNSRDQSPHPLR